MESQIWHGKAEDLAHNLPDGINLLVTDPPFGIDFKSNSVRRGASEKFTESIDNDDDPELAIENFSEVMRIITPKLADNADIYVFTSWQVFPQWKAAMELLGFPLWQVLVWEKGYPGMGDLEYNWGCGYELILYAKNGRRPVNYRRRGVITIDRLPSGKNFHPTQKPVGLLELLIEMSTEPGDLVVDPYAGSGSAIWAADRTGRVGIGIEMKQDYVRRASEQLEQTGFQLEY